MSGKSQPKHLVSGWLIAGKKRMFIYVMGLDCSVTTNYFIWKCHLEWMYTFLFMVSYQSLNLHRYFKNAGLGWPKWYSLVSHILSITSDSLWGFFWGAWVLRPKEKVFIYFFNMCLPSFQIFCWKRSTEIHWQKASGWIDLSLAVNLGFSDV